jgi:hypothetical protein
LDSFSRRITRAECNTLNALAEELAGVWTASYPLILLREIIGLAKCKFIYTKYIIKFLMLKTCMFGIFFIPLQPEIWDE